jgi:hypothetical protein
MLLYRPAFDKLIDVELCASSNLPTATATTVSLETGERSRSGY